ncbi:Hypothetical predicted protein [Marmota monax]|uniref:Uncharacterized protein n=1 Tax=Marmota monax TaxID=9995 RepID=A0A5E4CQ33_MARMO|nr:hypothetical protein GHT09_004895 [Marmota monax]VTJ83062.1 Hypothetical predicted protein [Marmota monax]
MDVHLRNFRMLWPKHGGLRNFRIQEPKDGCAPGGLKMDVHLGNFQIRGLNMDLHLRNLWICGAKYGRPRNFQIWGPKHGHLRNFRS